MSTSITTFNLDDSNLSAGESTTLNLVFTTPVVGFSTRDLLLDGVTISDLRSTDGGQSWTATVTTKDNFNGEGLIRVRANNYFNATDGTTGDRFDYKFDVDTTVPLTPSISVQSTGDDNVYNLAEVGDDGTVTATITLPTSGNSFETTKPGDTLTVNGEDYTITQDMIDNGFDIEIAPQLEPTQITAIITDTAGNSSELVTQTIAGADLETPEVSISIDSITEDNVVNYQESTQDITVTGTVTGEYNEGDTVTLTVGSQEYSAQLNSDGTYSTSIPGNVLADSSEISATINTADAAGNSGTASTQITYNVDTDLPVPTLSIDAITDDNIINATEANGSITVTGVVGGEFSSGDTVTITSGSDTFETTVGSDGSFSIDLPGAVLKSNPSLNASVTTTDAAGNVGNASIDKNYVVDTDAPSKPTVKIADGDDYITADEIDEDGNVEVTIGLPGDAVEGDTVTVNGEDIVLSQDNIDNGSIIAQVSEPAEGETLEVEVTVTDIAGNESEPGTSEAFKDTTDPVATATIESYIDDVAPVTSDNSTAEFTNDDSITLQGSIDQALAAGEAINVYDNGELIGQATVNGTAWSLADVAIDTDGSTFTVKTIDAAGNTTDGNGSLDITLDTTDPVATATIESYIDDVAPVTSDNSTAKFTNDDSITLQGSLDQALADGEAINVYDNGELIGQATVNGTAWSLPDVAIDTDGSTFTVKTIDAAGNTTDGNGSLDITLDTTDPVATATIESYIDDVAPVTSDNSTAKFTNDDSITLQGSLDQALADGEAINVYDNGELIGQATVNGTAWSLADVAIDTDGSTFTVETIDAAGNTTDGNGSLNITLDTTDPVATATIESYIDDVAPVTSDNSTAEFTNDDSITLQGSLDQALADGEAINVYDNGELIGQATVNGTAWSLADVAIDTDGSTFTVETIDAAGNTTDGNGSLDITLDVTDPMAVATIESYIDDVAPVTSDNSTAEFTNDDSITLQGSLDQALADGEAINVYDNGELIGQATVNGTAWSLADVAIDTDGSTFTVETIDAAGNTTDGNGSLDITLDVTDPMAVATIESYIDDVAPVTSDNSTAEFTNDDSITLQGSLDQALADGEAINVYDNGELIGQATVNGTAWSLADVAIDTDGSTFTVETIDAAGNTTDGNGSLDITLDVTDPMAVATIESYIDDVAPVTSDNSTAAFTNDDSITLQGSLDQALADGEAINVYDNGELIGQATVNGTAWSLADVAIDTDGSTFTVETIDAAGNSTDGNGSLNITLDTTDPMAVATIESYIDDVEPVTSDNSTAEFTNDDSITLQGSLDQALADGEAINVYDNGELIGQATVNGTAWSLADVAIDTDGSTFTVETIDAAGNTTDGNGSLDITLDVTPPEDPTTTLTLEQITGDNVLMTDEIAQTFALTGAVDGEFNEGDVVTINVNGTDYTDTVSATGDFSVEVAGTELAADTDTIVTAAIAATDSSGNVGNITTSQDYIVQPTIELANSNDTGISNTDDITQDGTLTIDNRGDTIQSVEASRTSGDTVTLVANNGIYVLEEGDYSEVTVTTTETTANGSTNTVSNSFGPVEVDQTAPSAPTLTTRSRNSLVFDDEGNFVRVDLKGSARIESSTDTDTTLMSFTYTDETYNSETGDIGVTHEATVTRVDGEWQWLEFDGVNVSDDPSVVQSAVILESSDLNDDGVDEAVVTISSNRLLDNSDVIATDMDIAGNVSETATIEVSDDDFTRLNYNIGPDVGEFQDSAGFLDAFNGEIAAVGFVDENGEFTQITPDDVFTFDVAKDAEGNINGYGFSVNDVNGAANDLDTGPNSWTYDLIAFDSNYNQIFAATQVLIESPPTI